jgi:hypothetical protein
LLQYRLLPRLKPLLGEREGTYDEKFEGGESDDEVGDDEDVKGAVTSSLTRIVNFNQSINFF